MTMALDTTAAAHDAIVIGSMETRADADAFCALNEEWISAYFSMEPADRRTLDDPFGSIVGSGGDVLIARSGGVAVGCVALMPEGHGVYELSKMAVAPAARNRGIGRKLLEAAIGRARERGASVLFLGSNSRLASAVHLYESVGFEHVPPERIGPMPYERANVFMRMELVQQESAAVRPISPTRALRPGPAARSPRLPRAAHGCQGGLGGPRPRPPRRRGRPPARGRARRVSSGCG